MKSHLIIFLSLILPHQAFSFESLSQAIQETLVGFSDSRKVILSDEIVFSPASVDEFYATRAFEPAWIIEQKLNMDGLMALNLIANADNDGLNPKDYHYQKIMSLKALLDDSKLTSTDISPVHLELLITDGFLLLSSHVSMGKLNAKTYLPQWTIQRDDTVSNRVTYLEESLNNKRLEKDFEMLLPQSEEYNALKSGLASMKLIESENGWKDLVYGSRLELDSVDARVVDLRERLRIEGYNTSDTTDQETFDEELESVIKIYQINHGLEADGIVGNATIRSLNVSVQERIDQILLNLERWRWYEAKLKTDHVRVNITNFNLEVFENQKVTFECKAIVGKSKRPTPEFNAMISYIVINPYWRIPSGILTRDIIPAAKKDANYLNEKSIRVLNGDAIVDSKKIDWQTVDIWKYTYRQDPGKFNSMGLIKFMFPNSYNVYIHDTPIKSLFEQTERTFSSGCIRIQKPVLLAELLLKSQSEWDLEKIMTVLEEGDPSVSIDLEQPFPVNMLYYTAWGKKNETLQFRKDIYKKDGLILKGLHASVPSH